jgi:hypothetical protein
MDYELQTMSGERAKRILQGLLTDLSNMEVEDLTTFELGILHKAAKNPPKRYHGAEERITG